MVAAMAIVIEFYVPEKFRKNKAEKWIPRRQHGMIIRFPAPEEKSA
jgi:hypothetical protein